MKSITRLLRLQRQAFMILVVFNSVAFAQNNGYWDNRFGPPHYLYDYVSAIALVDGHIYVGGSFNNHKNIATWDNKGWSGLGAGITGSVLTLAVLGNDLYAGGGFSWAGNLPANNIAKWNLVTQSWSALESNGQNGVNGTVWALAAHGNKLYVGGHFTTAGGVPAKGIAVWNDSSKTWSPLGQGVDGYVNAIAVSKRWVYFGGKFTSAAGKPANNIAKWDGKECFALGNGVSSDGNPSFPTPHVNAIAILGSEVYVGGGFIKAGDVDANSIAKWNVIDKRWSALGSGNTNGIVGNVQALATNDRAIYVGGTFGQAGDQSANYIAKWDPNNNSWSSLGNGVNGQVFAIATYGKDVHVGGGFGFPIGSGYQGGKRYDRFAIWHEPNEPPVINALPEITFNEDDSLLFPIRNWFDYVSDVETADRDLLFKIFPKPNLNAVQRDSSFLFTAAPNWYGTRKLKLVVEDRGELTDSTWFVVNVKPANDPPVFHGLPDSLILRQNAPTELNLWEVVSDAEAPDSLLKFSFAATPNGFGLHFNPNTGALKISAANFSDRGRLYITVQDRKQAVARDTLRLYVESAPLAKATAGSELPTEFVLQQNYPNPFWSGATSRSAGNPTTLIRFGLPEDAEVKIDIFNLAGQHVTTLMNEPKAAGYHDVLWQAKGLSSGMYFYRLTAGNFSAMKKLMLMR